MRSVLATALAVAGALSIGHVSAQQPPAQPPATTAQPPATTAQPPAGGRMGGMQMNPADAARKVPGGGIFASG